jgi:hypothetical protein
VYLLLLLAVAVAGSEAIASFLVPSWPARDIRPLPVASAGDVTYNDWALRDRPRTFERPADVRFRSVLVGDSFLEGPFLRAPLSSFLEQRLATSGNADMEAINLGVSGTGPQQYYYRIKNVALALRPDAIVLMVYAGNDFIVTRFGESALPFIAELPQPSLLGAIAPRTTWFAVNRLLLSEFGRSNKPIEGEFEQLNAWLDLPAGERLDRFVRHIKQHYYPGLGEAAIKEILTRGDDRFWSAFDKRADREFVAGWLLNVIIGQETAERPMPRNAEEADRMDGAVMVDETLSWLVAAERLARDSGVKLVVGLVPVGTVDPAYADFWRFWPKYLSFALGADARHRRLATALRRAGVRFFDLREDLDGVAGTYRLTDGHWTERGTELAADRVARELLKLRAP